MRRVDEVEVESARELVATKLEIDKYLTIPNNQKDMEPKNP